MFECKEYIDETFVVGFVNEDGSWEALFFCFNKRNAAALTKILNEVATLAKLPRKCTQKQNTDNKST